MRNIKLTIEYDGKDFNGWQKQPHNFPEMVKFEIQIWTTEFLVPWLLCRHGR